MSFYERETEQRGEIEEITLTQVENAAQGSLIRTLIVSGTLLTVLGAVSLGLLRDGIQSWMPTSVSYTHLDVYKRQELGDRHGRGTCGVCSPVSRRGPGAVL